MNTWVQALLRPEPVAVMVLLILIGSLIQGVRRGASGSAKHLFFFIWQAVSVVLSLLLAGRAAERLSPLVRDWLLSRNIQVPKHELSTFKQIWYTIVTSLRDFDLLRFGLIFLITYTIFRYLLGWLQPLFGLFYDSVLRISENRRSVGDKLLSGTASRATGAMIGALLGAGRAFVVIAILFVYVSMLPSGPLTESIRSSAFYAKTASELLSPVAGDVLTRGPVFTDAVAAEFRRVLQRKYEVIDSAVPANIEQAAIKVTKKARTDEEKARALYDWVGTRIAYDWDKANNYEDNGVWKEQTPAETFNTHKGVCIDVARLYAVMARSVGLEVRVVTGLGATGKGDYGPHAWNEVRLADQGGGWIPLDATWASSGNWFNPSGFSSTHLRET
ncbi:hypothetical protein Back11_30280 [Paenibacillus baekrokdamisoli]|uniref:Uncharacterized protein n=1 Tax=Paenibacillus baekrokdamisoli TaxID=1712516 RepID=A0A3G9J9W7_9BACL|nr:transglutaminase domain-containing protein [Paenibacillus baekrokdamisoli]MBB3073081.1 hypothetical protein [Paenibacillus baekrokdamisoli]BBH21683.1 hypothetical protein Back11_30280 [Paenibacillus baekrokdamisoli]